MRPDSPRQRARRRTQDGGSACELRELCSVVEARETRRLATKSGWEAQEAPQSHTQSSQGEAMQDDGDRSPRCAAQARTPTLLRVLKRLADVVAALSQHPEDVPAFGESARSTATHRTERDVLHPREAGAWIRVAEAELEQVVRERDHVRREADPARSVRAVSGRSQAHA